MACSEEQRRVIQIRLKSVFVENKEAPCAACGTAVLRFVCPAQALRRRGGLGNSKGQVSLCSCDAQRGELRGSVENRDRAKCMHRTGGVFSHHSEGSGIALGRPGLLFLFFLDGGGSGGSGGRSSSLRLGFRHLRPCFRLRNRFQVVIRRRKPWRFAAWAALPLLSRPTVRLLRVLILMWVGAMRVLHVVAGGPCAGKTTQGRDEEQRSKQPPTIAT